MGKGTVLQGLKARLYPPGMRDGTLTFYTWLRQSVRPDFIVCNVGAGPAADRRVKCLRGEVRRVVGIDIDSVVLKNDDLDEAVVLKEGRWPVPDEHFDLAWADFVLEHVKEPEKFLREVYRILKPTASFFFRTPNKYHYVSMIARATPHWFHESFANRVRLLPVGSHDPYPTFHLLNSHKSIEWVASAVGFREIELRYFEGEPSYLVFHPLPFIAGALYERLVNASPHLERLRSNIFGRLQK